MSIDYSELNFLKDPELCHLKADYDQFLLSLTGPTVIDISGKDPTRARVITTLIHGNEPSGIIAIHRWLSALNADNKPQTDLRFIICSPEAANYGTMFSHRFLEHGLDLNRCFGNDLQYGYFKRARLIEDAINQVMPEVIVDIHNTPGSSPTFAVSANNDEISKSITALFGQTLILSEIKIGALTEQDFDCATLTVECGSSQDVQAHEVAFSGISHLANLQHMSDYAEKLAINVFRQPLRLQLKPETELSFATKDEGKAGITIIDNIEQHNYGVIHRNQMLGWVDAKGLQNLQIIDQHGTNVIEQYFSLRSNQLVTNTDINIFMATRNKAAAISDCLFYVHKN